MKKFALLLVLSSVFFGTAMHAVVEGERFVQSEEAVTTARFGHIDAKGLKAMIDSKTPFTLIDARGDKWSDGNTLPGAKFASYESSEELLESIIPQKDSLVVVYCFSSTCPLSPMMIERLLEIGYSNIVEYPAGLKEWRDIAHYPVDIVQH